MKKTNKILAKALVIILSLVLITSCVVSSTFAKYVVTKSASTKVELQKFGITVTLDPITSLKDSSSGKITKAGDSITYELKNVTLIPGDTTTYKNLFQEASVTGTPSVGAKLKIEVTVTGANDTYFNISSADFNKLANSQCGIYNPITVYVAGEARNSDEVYKPLTGSSSVINTEIASELKEGLETRAAGATTDGMTLTAGQQVDSKLGNLNIGFAWDNPGAIEGTDDVDYANEIMTWLSNTSKMSATETNSFNITYRISVEQG